MQIHLTYRNSLRNVKRRVLHNLGLAMYYITRPGSLRANGRCAPTVATRHRSLGALSFCGPCASWFQRSFQLLVSVGDCVPWFQRSLTAAGSIALIRFAIGRFYKLVWKVGWCFYLAWMPFRLSHPIFLRDWWACSAISLRPTERTTRALSLGNPMARGQAPVPIPQEEYTYLLLLLW